MIAVAVNKTDLNPGDMSKKPAVPRKPAVFCVSSITSTQLTVSTCAMRCHKPPVACKPPVVLSVPRPSNVSAKCSRILDHRRTSQPHQEHLPRLSVSASCSDSAPVLSSDCIGESDRCHGYPVTCVAGRQVVKKLSVMNRCNQRHSGQVRPSWCEGRWRTANSPKLDKDVGRQLMVWSGQSESETMLLDTVGWRRSCGGGLRLSLSACESCHASGVNEMCVVQPAMTCEHEPGIQSMIGEAKAVDSVTTPQSSIQNTAAGQSSNLLVSHLMGDTLSVPCLVGFCPFSTVFANIPDNYDCRIQARGSTEHAQQSVDGGFEHSLDEECTGSHQTSTTFSVESIHNPFAQIQVNNSCAESNCTLPSHSTCSISSEQCLHHAFNVQWQEAVYEEIDALALPDHCDLSYCKAPNDLHAACTQDQSPNHFLQVKAHSHFIGQGVSSTLSEADVSCAWLRKNDSLALKDDFSSPVFSIDSQMFFPSVDTCHNNAHQADVLLCLPSLAECTSTSLVEEIEQALNVKLLPSDGQQNSGITPVSGNLVMPVRPPRPRRAEKLQQLSIPCPTDSGNVEPVSSDLHADAPVKPRRRTMSISIYRSMSDVSEVRSVDNVQNKAGDRPYPLPRRQSLRQCSDQKPPPLPPRNKCLDLPRYLGQEISMSKLEGNPAIFNCPAGPCIGHTVAVTSSTGDRSSCSRKVHLPSDRRHLHRQNHPSRPVHKAPPPPCIVPYSIVPLVSDVSSGCPVSVGHLSMTSSAQRFSSLICLPDGLPVFSSTCQSGTALQSLIASSHVCSTNSYLATAAHVSELISVADGVTVSLSDPAEKTCTLPGERYSNCDSEFLSTIINVCRNSGIDDILWTPATTIMMSAEVKSSICTEVDGNTVSSSPMLNSVQFGGRAPGLRAEGICKVSQVTWQPAYLERPVSTQSDSSSTQSGSSSTQSGSSSTPSEESAVDASAIELSSESDSLTDLVESVLRAKKEKKAFMVAQELMKSEQVFVGALKLLNVDFRVFVSQKTEELGHAVIPTDILNKILDFLPQLQSFNEMLLNDFTERISNWESNKSIADIFVKKGPFLKLFSSYISNFENAVAVLDESCKKYSHFNTVVREFETSPRCAGLALRHYMLKPIQRIPQYKLLLQDYLKHLNPDSFDYKDTTAALVIVSEVAGHANQAMRVGDDLEKLLEVQRSLIGSFEVIQPGRVLLKQGELMKLSRKEMQPRMFFLFNDVLLYTTPFAAGGNRLNNVLPLHGMKVSPPKQQQFCNEFNILTTQRSLILAAKTLEGKEVWLTALWSAIDENSDRYHTFKAMQPAPKTSLLDKDFVVGSKSPLLVPDTRVTMCMLCLSRFSTTWRRHHCRACGRVVCGNCSKNKAPLCYMMYRSARVCDECFSSLEKELESYLHTDRDQCLSACVGAASADSSSSSSAPKPAAPSDATDSVGVTFAALKTRFRKMRGPPKDRLKFAEVRPSVLKEVHANDEDSAVSGYLWLAKNGRWKQLWFVVKGNVLYTYKASQVYQGVESDLLFELLHQNIQPLVCQENPANILSSNCSNGGHTRTLNSASFLPPIHDKSGMSSTATTSRLIFHSDNADITSRSVHLSGPLNEKDRY